MANINDIVELSKKYLEAHDKRNLRVKMWHEHSYGIVQHTLNKILKEITDKNDFFKNNLHVVNRKPALGIFLKSGKILVPAEEPTHEDGFEIHFSPFYNGKIHVYVNEHAIDNNPNYTTIEVIDDLSILTEEKITELVFTALETVYKSSYLFMLD